VKSRITRHQVALFTAELMQGIGHAMELKWVIEGKADTGTFCTVQGITYLGHQKGISDSSFRAHAAAGRTCSCLGHTCEPQILELTGHLIFLGLQNIAVQTFLKIWSLKSLSRTISAVVIGIEFLFVIIFATVEFVVHTHPTKEYFTTPAPVRFTLVFFSVVALTFDSTGVGLVTSSCENEQGGSMPGFG
jgi:hypothetical protein